MINIKEGNKERIIGIAIIAIVVLITVVVVTSLNGGNKSLKKVYVATGGGKEDFIADKDVTKILEKKYNLDVIYDSWSNGKTVSLPLVREAVHLGKNIPESEWSVNNDSCSKYDVLFTSDLNIPHFEISGKEIKDEHP